MRIQEIFRLSFDISHLSFASEQVLLTPEILTSKDDESSLMDHVPVQNHQPAKRTLQSRADELEERLIDFAVRIVRLSASLPRTTAGRHIAGQILRSGTSPAPNYGEARGA